ncbi:excalibur calcium-binding domain-containing protein [Streptomyces buecherae]|uniref:excalibur calcium-binding domain-containing protein n=1 Tax=Streptomyces buecherae TaxID=2763006 RepID=UPI0020B8406E|nr:excalibur calcium-binding domain-containing protein [Streptomyces buecherae]
MSENDPVRSFEQRLQELRQRGIEEQQQRDEQRQAKKRLDRQVDITCAVGCLVLVPALLALAWWGISAVWKSRDENSHRSSVTTSPSPSPSTSMPTIWHLDEEYIYDGETTIWTDKNKFAQLPLLEGVSASDMYSDRTDELSEISGLGPPDVVIKVLKSPRHGSLTFGNERAKPRYTPRPGFSGEDEVVYSVKLKSRTEVAEVTHRIKVELSPGGEWELTHKFENCGEARAAGSTPIYRGEPGYGLHLDADGDGIGCDAG